MMTSRFKISLLMIACIWASFSLYARGAPDYFSPLLLGIGLWVLSRLESWGRLLRRIFVSGYGISAGYLLIERSEGHSLFYDGSWRWVESSLPLYLTGILLIFYGIIILFPDLKVSSATQQISQND